MLKRIVLLCIITLLFISEQKAQDSGIISIIHNKNNFEIAPGEIVNIPFFVQNNSNDSISISIKAKVPEGLKLIPTLGNIIVKLNEKKFSIFSVRANQFCSVGDKTLDITVYGTNNKKLGNSKVVLRVKETKKLTVQLIESPEYIFAGQTMDAKYLVQNLGNTAKKVILESYNCEIVGDQTISLNPGESVNVEIKKHFADEYREVSKEFFSLKTIVSNEITNSVFKPVLVFPSGNTKTEIYHRFPMSVSSTYLSTNYRGMLQNAHQFELFGSGKLDTKGNHSLEFLARGPNNAHLSFLGLYDQYYISYFHNNFEFSVGDQSYTFTPLTESSRFGFGLESKVKFNNGLSFGYTFVKPRFYDLIENESALYSQYKRDKNNLIAIYYVLKKDKISLEKTDLYSLNTKFTLFKSSIFDLEFSRGKYKNVWDNAFRANIDTKVSILSLSGNYFCTGKYYPGYYSNSTFYSGNATLQVSKNIGIGIMAREDFTNAKLDTFFVIAPYSKSFQTFINYRLSKLTNFKFFYRKHERKDRLADDKFHYQTNSVNTQFNRKLKKVEYQLLGEVGKTTNFLLGEEKNKQNTFRGTASFSYKINPQNAVRLFGSWSNINSFISNSQRNITAGMSVFSKVNDKLKIDFHIQNAFDIDDYYRNRNLMQLHINYKFLKNHSVSVRSFYTLFRQREKDPDFTVAATYTVRFGVPLKKIMKAGSVKGRIINEVNEPVEGIILHLQNKSAVTNKKGEYNFKTVAPGNRLLTVEKSKLKIDEITNIPLPLNINITENRETEINLEIIKGAKVEGKISIDKTTSTLDIVHLENIVIDLKSDLQNYRITTDETGAFTFPLVIPGTWTLKIYQNSLPKGYELESNSFKIHLLAGEFKTLQIPLKKIVRKIIFKNQNFTLSTNGKINGKPIRLKNPNTKSNIKPKEPESFYSVQVGAFKTKVNSNSNYFKEKTFDFVMEFNNLNKYFIGKYKTYEDAQNASEELKRLFKGAFVVFIDGNEVIQLRNKKIKK